MLLDFAVTCEADQTILTAEMQRRGLRGSSVQVVERPLDSPLPQLSGPASSYARCAARGGRGRFSRGHGWHAGAWPGSAVGW